MASPRKDPFRLAPWVVIAGLAWLVLFPITSVDVYYHLASGRFILDGKSIPSRGVGSATFGDAPWHDNEWGFQVIAALLGDSERREDGTLHLTARGRAALILFRALVLAATLAVLSAQMARSGVPALARAVSLLLASSLTFGNLFWGIRPQILSFLGLAAVAYLLARDREGRRWAAPATLLVVAVWSNLHGSMLVGLALVFCEAVGEAIDGTRDRLRRLVVLGLLGAPAACLNPYGYRQLIHPFLYLFDAEVFSGNIDWVRPDLLRLPLLVLTVALTAAALHADPRRRVADVVRIVVFVGLFLTAVRHLPLLVVVVVPVLASAATRVARERGFEGRTASRQLLAAGVVAAVAVALSGARFFSFVPKFEERTLRPMPERAVSVLAREGVEGNGFNEYRFGGFLMFRLYPQERVFMDGRNDLYRGFRDRVYNRILETRGGWRPVWEDAVERYDVGWVLLDEGGALARALAGDATWVPGPVLDGNPGEDGIVLFLASTERNRKVIAGLTP